MKAQLMSMQDFCEFTNISLSTGYRLAREGKVPHFRVGSKILFDKTIVEEWIREQSVKTEVKA